MAMFEPAPMITRLKQLNMAAYAPFIALLLLILFSSIASESFLMPRNITNVLRQVSYTGIIALGMTFVIIAGGIDLSVGSMVAVVGVRTIRIINGAGDGWWAVAMS
ncbi:ABC transporter permease subunit, partial [Marinomonas sp.]|uniref:ABC transporter permease subunit n=1 Tax=Marinomonas sp. TaxID=1904862 RepID=UPI003C7124A6